MALVDHLPGGAGNRCDLQSGGTRSLQGSTGMESRSAFPGMLPCVFGFFQDLERSDGGRKRRHVAPSRTDDFPDGSAGGGLYALAAERAVPQSAGG